MINILEEDKLSLKADFFVQAISSLVGECRVRCLGRPLRGYQSQMRSAYPESSMLDEWLKLVTDREMRLYGKSILVNDDTGTNPP